MSLEQIKKSLVLKKNRSIQIAKDENRREDLPKVGGSILDKSGGWEFGIIARLLLINLLYILTAVPAAFHLANIQLINCNQ